MRVKFDAGGEMTARDVFAISLLLKERKLEDGQEATRLDLARLLECTHEGGDQMKFHAGAEMTVRDVLAIQRLLEE